MRVLSEPIASGSIVSDIVRRIENAILTGELIPGERISEQGISKQLGVSRGALREALRQLEGRGLVERTANIGARITMLSDQELVEIFQVWEALGSLASRLATPLISESDLKHLRSIVSSYETSGDNRQRNFNIHTQFHMKIVAVTGNTRLINTCQEIFDVLQLYRGRLMSAPQFFERSREVIEEQLAIINAMAARDATQAEHAMHRHLVASLRYQTDVIGPANSQ
jgi:DNA-binding GntR family transcriptional regulator